MRPSATRSATSPAIWRSWSVVRAERTMTCSPSGAARSTRSTGPSGYSSSTMCTFAPPAPNELTPARSGGLAGPVGGVLGYVQGGRLEIDLRVEPFQPGLRDERAVPQLQDGLGQPGDAGGRLQVADHRLHRADGAAVGPARPSPQRLRAAQRSRSGRPARCRCRAPRRSRGRRALDPGAVRRRPISSACAAGSGTV